MTMSNHDMSRIDAVVTVSDTHELPGHSSRACEAQTQSSKVLSDRKRACHYQRIGTCIYRSPGLLMYSQCRCT